MVNYVAESTGDAFSTLIERVIEAIEIRDSEGALTALACTGSVCIMGRHFDFGVQASQKDGEIFAQHFVNEAKDTRHYDAVCASIDAFFKDTDQQLTTYARAAYPVPADGLPAVNTKGEQCQNQTSE